MSLSQFASNLPVIGLAAGQTPFSLAEIDLFVIHTLINVSTLHLHRELAQTQPVPYEKCWIAANAVTSLVRELADSDYNYLDPIISVSTLPDYWLRPRYSQTLLTGMLALHCGCVRQDVGSCYHTAEPKRERHC